MRDSYDESGRLFYLEVRRMRLCGAPGGVLVVCVRATGRQFLGGGRIGGPNRRTGYRRCVYVLC
jgi:hypothetical protein